MTAPVLVGAQPALLPYQQALVMGARRMGKTAAAMAQLGQAMRRSWPIQSIRPMPPLRIFRDEYELLFPIASIIERRDRSHFERGGRYRKPPMASTAQPSEPGMVQVRDRSGALIWKKIGKGIAAGTREAEMRALPLWGSF